MRPRQKAGPVLLWVPRAVFFIPRYAIDIAVHPVRLGLMAYEKYALRHRVEDIFFNDERTFGAFPLAFVETGFGLNAGARLVHRDMAGHGESLRVRASFGGLYRQRYQVGLGTGQLLGDRFALGLDAQFRVLSRARFYGLGNDDERSFDPEAAPLNAWRDSGVETRYRRDEMITRLGARISFTPHARLLLMQDMTWRRFDSAQSGSAPQLDEVFDLRSMPGFRRGQVRSYSEAAIVLDTTSYAGPHIPPSTPSSGWLLRGSGGIGIGFGPDPSRYLRWGADVQRFIDIYQGNRVLRLRGYVDAVDGRLDEVVFVDLPALGGPNLLRGYVRDRFRGRIAGLLSAEYSFPIDRIVGGFLFTDVGRVWTRLPLSMTAPRVGYGGGLVFRTQRRFLARLQMGSSLDGGFFFQLRFEPTWRIDDDV